MEDVTARPNEPVEELCSFVRAGGQSEPLEVPRVDEEVQSAPASPRRRNRILLPRVPVLALACLPTGLPLELKPEQKDFSTTTVPTVPIFTIDQSQLRLVLATGNTGILRVLAKSTYTYLSLLVTYP